MDALQTLKPLLQ